VTGFEKSWRIYMEKGLARTNTPTFLKSNHTSHLPAYEDGTDSVPKRQHIKFRHRGITQK